VLAHVHEFRPYFYVPAPRDFQGTPADVESFRKGLADALNREGGAGGGGGDHRGLLDVELVQRQRCVWRYRIYLVICVLG